MTPEQFKRWNDKDAIMMLFENDFLDYRKMEKPKGEIITNIILDDCISDKTAFSSKKDCILTKSILNGRHYSVNIIIASQNIKQITKSIRANTELWALFTFKSEKIILDDLYPKVSNLVTEDDFLHIYQFATSQPNGCLVIDMKEKNKEDRFKLNFDKIIRLNK